MTETFRALAEAFRAEGTEVHFTLMGDGNMHWATALAELGTRTYHLRHEHCAVSAAMGYANATGRPGVASVTSGPGLTQIMTALSTAVRASLPVVVFAGESPIDAGWNNQAIEQAPFVTATGAHYIAAHSLKRMGECVRDAFLIARTQSRPVVLGVPYDLQKRPWPGPAAHVPSTAVMADGGRAMPDPEHVARAAEAIASAERVVVVGGRGAKKSGAAEACLALAERTGGLLATTLPVRGLFHESPWDLGVAGGFATETAREKFAEADLVIMVGASVTHHTADGGSLYPKARVLQIDTRPVGIHQGRRVADLYLRADARAGVEAVTAALGGRNLGGGAWRTPALARRIAEAPGETTPFEIEPGVLDPRAAVAELDRVLPKGWEMVNSSGHCSFFTSQMRGRAAEHFHTIREFGAIGNGLSYAIGVAAAKPEQTVVLFDGDGGFLMHAQELETVRRHGLRILMCILNDGAYGSEIHKLRADGLDDSGSVFGRGDLAAVARGFGLRGSVVTELGRLPELLRGFEAAPGGELWDIHISDRVTSPVMRKAHPAKAH